MPIFLVFLANTLMGVLAAALPSLIGRALLALGLGFATYKGADVAVNYIFTAVKNAFGGVPGAGVQFLAFMWIDKALSLMFSAFTTALAIKTAAGSLTKLVAKSK